MNPLVSIIMPVYNSEKYISAAIDSIIDQSYSNWELILIIDCPTDNTIAAIEKYSDLRIVKIYNDKNRGIAYSRNRGLKLARGKYIALLDDDDEMFPDRLEKQAEYLEEHEEVGAVGGRTIFIDENECVLDIDNMVYFHPKEVYCHLFFHNVLMNGSVMFRSVAAIENNIYYRDNCYGMEDFDFWVRLSNHVLINHLDQYVLKYRMHSENESTKVTKTYMDQKKEKYAQIQINALETAGFSLTETDKQVIKIVLAEMRDKIYSWDEYEKIRNLLAELMRQAELNNQMWRLQFIDVCKKIEVFIYRCTNVLYLTDLEMIPSKALPCAKSDFLLDKKLKDKEDYRFIKEKNPYIIKQELGLEYVLSDDGESKYRTDAAVFVHLYYVDLLEECFQYILEACKTCTIYISTSVQEVNDYIEKKCREMQIKNCNVIMIDNRGQDIAALLLYHAKIMKNYKYICFLHDKKSKHVEKQNGYIWFKDLWENTLSSSGYILNVVTELENDERLGMLSVPEPFWGEFISTVENGWSNNFAETEKLSQRLNLECKLERDFPPISIGTAFWAKSEALYPLLAHTFNIEEFPETGVGELSYAVERIFPFVVQSCGYYTGIVETKRFSTFRKTYLQNLVMRTTKLLSRRLNIYNERTLERYQIMYDKIDTFVYSFSRVYVYGTGKRATRFVHLYPNIISLIAGFVKTELEYPGETFCGKNVYAAKSVLNKDSGFIVTLSDNLALEVYEYLLGNGASITQIVNLSTLFRVVE